MKNILVPLDGISKKAFTLVELLVVITILAIISVVAYQNFGGAVDKAVSGRKISDVSTIETALQQYKADNNYYPATDIYSTSNLWGYSGGTVANRSNIIKVVYNGQAITNIVIASTKGGGYVTASGTTATKIGFKGTISQKTLGKKYLTKDLYDPELGDIIEETTKTKFIKKGIGRYIYAIYKKGGNNIRGNDYNMAYTIKKKNSDKYITKIVGSYDKESCYGEPTDCPDTLIGTKSGSILLDGSEQKLTGGSIDTIVEDQGIPYPVTDFSK